MNNKTYFKYLDDLRDSGRTNMFDAVPYLIDAFDLSKEKAKEILLLWVNKKEKEN